MRQTDNVERMLLNIGSFDSPADEAAYYRERYRRIVDMLEDARAELGTSGNSSNFAVLMDQTSFRYPRRSSKKSWRRNLEPPRSDRPSWTSG